MTQDHAAAHDIIRRIARHWPELSPRIRPAIIYLYRARDLLLGDVENILKPLGMRPSDVDVLAALRSQARPWQLTPTDLYRALLLSSGGLTKILHRLEDAGWIDRPPNPADRRSRLVRLTPGGSQQLQRALQLVLDHEDTRMAVLDEAEQAQLGELLDKLVGAWEKA